MESSESRPVKADCSLSAILFFSFSFLSKLFGDKYPSPECLRVGLYHDSIQVNMANLASVLFFQERLSINSHSRLAKKLSAIALS